MICFFTIYSPGVSGVSVTLFSLYYAPQTFCIVLDCLMESGPGVDVSARIQAYILPASTRIITKKKMAHSVVRQRKADAFPAYDKELTITSPGMEPLNTPLPLENYFARMVP